MMLEYI